MLAGTVVSAIIGGMAGLTYAVSHGHGLVEILLSYQIGGGTAVLAFVALSVSDIVRQG